MGLSRDNLFGNGKVAIKSVPNTLALSRALQIRIKKRTYESNLDTRAPVRDCNLRDNQKSARVSFSAAHFHA
jgi:hypothetical protein